MRVRVAVRVASAEVRDFVGFDGIWHRFVTTTLWPLLSGLTGLGTRGDES